MHSLPDILRARVLAIAAGYEDANDLDALRYDPAFMMALGKAPGEVIGLASQPTCSRWENAAGIRALIRMGREMVDIYCSSHDAPPDAVTLDIDDTFDTAHGQQQLSFWNGFHGERGFAPIHVYETASGRPVAFILRPARTPSGKEVLYRGPWRGVPGDEVALAAHRIFPPPAEDRPSPRMQEQGD